MSEFLPLSDIRTCHEVAATGAVEAQEFRRVLGAYPTGVCVITGLDGEREPLGLVIGSFTSVSLSPPRVGFLPGKTSKTWPVLERSGYFGVNVLGRDQLALCLQMAGPGPDKFKDVDFVYSKHKLPLLSGAVARIECRLHSTTDAGDHWFVQGTVLSLEVARQEGPLLFHRGSYGRFMPL